VEKSPTEIVYEKARPVLVLRAVVIRVASGPDKGATCALTTSRARVGTAADNALQLNDPRVSRHHIEFQIHDQGYLVRDLQSTNGTFYRGARVGEVLVEQGAEVRIGNTVLRLERSNEQTSIIGEEQTFGSLVGASPAMQQVYGLLAAVAPTDATVLVLGETGTGKELVAEEIHRNSPRHDRLFSVLDCGSIPASLIESELFGHVKGAFTGAMEDREGIFERTRGGTVFLDEIGELPMELQTRLLRVLDRRMVTRLGSNLPRKVDIRLVAATNKDLGKEVKEGRFRQDLYYRLAVVRIMLPALRERREDIRLLARFFLWQAGCGDPERVLTEDLLADLLARPWRGNVRELRNIIERTTVLTDGAALTLDGAQGGASMVPSEATAASEHPEVRADSFVDPGLLDLRYKEAKEQLLHRFEALYMGRLFEQHGNNISRIARDAGVDRHLVRKLLRKHGINE
jgi:DNA-binding NtrC family response regulator